jgi:hypothetical protein
VHHGTRDVTQQEEYEKLRTRGGKDWQLAEHDTPPVLDMLVDLLCSREEGILDVLPPICLVSRIIIKQVSYSTLKRRAMAGGPATGEIRTNTKADCSW